MHPFIGNTLRYRNLQGNRFLVASTILGLTTTSPGKMETDQQIMVVFRVIFSRTGWNVRGTYWHPHTLILTSSNEVIYHWERAACGVTCRPRLAKKLTPFWAAGSIYAGSWLPAPRGNILAGLLMVQGPSVISAGQNRLLAFAGEVESLSVGQLWENFVSHCQNFDTFSMVSFVR